MVTGRCRTRGWERAERAGRRAGLQGALQHRGPPPPDAGLGPRPAAPRPPPRPPRAQRGAGLCRGGAGHLSGPGGQCPAGCVAAVGSGSAQRAAGKGPRGREGPARGGCGKVTRKRGAPAGSRGPRPRWRHPCPTGVRRCGAPCRPSDPGLRRCRRVPPPALAAHLPAGPGGGAPGSLGAPWQRGRESCRRAAGSGRARLPAPQRGRNAPGAAGERTARAATPHRSVPFPGSLRFQAFSLAGGFGEVLVGFLNLFSCCYSGLVVEVSFPPSKCGLFFLVVKGKK